MRSQPSTPIDVSLHCLEWVPKIPSRGFFSQNPGEVSMYTKSFVVGGLCSGLYGFNWKLYLSETKRKKKKWCFSVRQIAIQNTWQVITYLFNFLFLLPLDWIALLDTLFGLEAIFFDVLIRWLIAFSLVFRKLFVTCTREAPSKRSFKLSPTVRKLGNLIQQVFTVQEPDIPWHLHSWRISDWTCCNEKEKLR